MARGHPPHFLQRRTMYRSYCRIGALLPFALAWGLWARADDAPKTDLPLLFQEDFKKGAKRWQPSDAKAWKVVKTDKGSVYNQFKTGAYQPPHRSPFNMAIVRDLNVTVF